MSIASAEASDVIKWARASVGKRMPKMSDDLSRAVASIKVKANGESVDCEVKLLDKLKAIELYFKLCGVDTDTTDGTLYIDYDYISPTERNED
ncbi:MAG: hypothetical protein J6A54_04195 [Clostridia bacterium]|nr:hypothetical protein [Clostridia bacterium]